MSKLRTRKFVTKILRKTCSSLVKLFLTKRKILHKISTFFAQNKCKNANTGSSTVQLQGVGRPDRYSSSKFIIKTYFYII